MTSSRPEFHGITPRQGDETFKEQLNRINNLVGKCYWVNKNRIRRCKKRTAPQPTNQHQSETLNQTLSDREWIGSMHSSVRGKKDLTHYSFSNAAEEWTHLLKCVRTLDGSKLTLAACPILEVLLFSKLANFLFRWRVAEICLILISFRPLPFLHCIDNQESEWRHSYVFTTSCSQNKWRRKVVVALSFSPKSRLTIAPTLKFKLSNASNASNADSILETSIRAAATTSESMSIGYRWASKQPGTAVLYTLFKLEDITPNWNLRPWKLSDKNWFFVLHFVSSPAGSNFGPDTKLVVKCLTQFSSSTKLENIIICVYSHYIHALHKPL